jgi:hypothetical protein
MNIYKLTGYCPNNPSCREITVEAENIQGAWLKAMTEHGMLSVYTEEKVGEKH